MPLNKQEQRERHVNCEWVKRKYQMTDGLTIGIDKVCISIPFNPPKPCDGQLPKGQTKQLALAQNNYKKESLNHINYVRSALRNFGFKTTRAKPIQGAQRLDRVGVYTEEDNSYVATVMLGLTYSTPVLSFSFNPSKLTDYGLDELEALLTLTLPNHYEGLYTDGVISQFEFFVDVEGVKVSDLVLLDIGKRKTTLYKSTTYNGRRGSPLVGTLYDKGAEQGTDHLLTRVEVRVKQREVTFQQLVESGISNPFSPFLLVPASALTVVANEFKCPALVGQILQQGLNGGIKNAQARKAITKRLAEFVVPWWNPDLLWDEFRKILLGFRPHFIGGGIRESYSSDFQSVMVQYGDLRH